MVAIAAAVFLVTFKWTLEVKAKVKVGDVHPTQQPLETKSIKLCNTTAQNFSILNSVQEGYQVPNIVHYIWYNGKSVDFTFHRALSVLSAVKHIKPDAVYFHTDNPPKGKYFEMLTNISIFKVKPSLSTSFLFE